MDREKVFDAFRNCITEPKCRDCPWETCEEFHQTKKIPLDLCLDILELLKEQEPAETKWASGINGGDALCGSCMSWLSDHSWAYCPRCGRRIKWE